MTGREGGSPRVAAGRRHFWPRCGGCWGRGRAPASPSHGPGAQGGYPLPHGTGALRGRGVGPGRVDPPRGADPGLRCGGGRGTSGTRRACGAPRSCESQPWRGPDRGGAPNFWAGSAGSSELGQTTKATPGMAWVPARDAGGSAGSATPLRLPPPGTSSGCAARLGEGGRGRWREPLAGRPGLCARCGSGSPSGPQPLACGRPWLWVGVAAKCLPDVSLCPPPPLSRPPAVCGFQVDFLGGWLLLC